MKSRGIVLPHEKSPVRVLQVVAAAGPSGSPAGGVNGPEQRTLNCLPHWRAFDVEPLVASPGRGRLNEAFRASGRLVADFEIASKFDFPSALRLARIIQSNAADVVHTQGPGSLDLIASVACAISRRPLIVTRPGLLADLPASQLKRLAYEFVDWGTQALCSSMVFVSAALRERQLRRAPWLRSKAEVVVNGVDLTRFRGLRRVRLGGGHLVCAAQFRPQKRLGDILTIVATLKEKGHHVTATIWGDGPERAALLGRIRALGLEDSIQMPGHSYDLPVDLSRGDLFVFPSEREGLSVAVIEALALGLPVLAAEAGAIRDQVQDDVNGFVLPVGDVADFVSRVEQLLMDPELSRGMGEESCRIAESQFSQEGMMLGYARLYRNALERSA